MILPAIAMIAPLGVALNSSPAQAAGTHSFTSNPIDAFLSNYGVNNEFILGSAFYAYGATRAAISGDTSQNWIFRNNGDVSSTSFGGITLDSASYVFNSGSISGDPYGVQLNGGGTVTNSGSASQIYSLNGSGIYAKGGSTTVVNEGAIASGTGNAIYLSAGGLVENKTNALIAGSNAGVNIFGGSGTVSNAGSITSDINAVMLGYGGSVTNLAGGSIRSANDTAVRITGTIGTSGVVANNGNIYGYRMGVDIYAPNMSVTNTGTIEGFSDTGVSVSGGIATIINSATGLISGGQYGVLACACSGPSTITNDGAIRGAMGVNLEQGGLVTNRGTITGTSGFGVYLLADGTVNNTGEINSPTSYGIVLASGGTITNGSSSISSAYVTGVGITGDGKLVNYGTIGPSNASGVYIQGGAATIVNSGRIVGAVYGVNAYNYLDPAAIGPLTLTNSGSIGGGNGGVYLGNGGIVTNTGTITGDFRDAIVVGGGTATIINGDANNSAALIAGYGSGINAEGCGCNPVGLLTITNQGTIRGDNQYGIFLGGGGTITNGSSSNHAALITGSAGGVDSYEAATVNNFGTISGTGLPGGGVLLEYGGLVNNYAGATISGTYIGVGIRGASGTVNNQGVIAATGTGMGLIAGVYMTGGGTLNNAAGASITGYAAGVLSFGFGGPGYGDAIVNNSGTIAATGTTIGTGVVIGYGTLNNQGLVTGPNSGVFLGSGLIINGSNSNHSATIRGGAGTGISALGNNTTLINYGVISSELNGLASLGGVVTNHAGASITGLYTGMLMGGTGTITNSGVITATSRAGTLPPAAGIALYTLGPADITVINNAGGLISGETGVISPNYAFTLANFGTITGTGGTAVQGPLTGNRLILGEGYKFNGAVNMGGTLEWAKGTGTLSNLAALNANFTALEIDAGTTITNASTGTVTLNLTNKGTIAPSAPVNLTGNFTQTASGALQAVLGPDGGATAINVTGAASLDGSVVVVPNGVSARQYTILTATGGVSGSFTSVSGGTLLLKPSLSYDAKDAFVTLNQQAVTSVADTPNQLALAAALDKGLAANPAAFAPVMNVLNQFTDAKALTGALESLTGEAHASLSTLALVTGLNMVGAFQSHAQGSAGANDAPDDPWITGFAQSGHFSPAGSQAVRENVMGVTAGADHLFFPGFRGGVMVGAGALHANGGTLSRTNITYQQIALTADYVNGAWFADGLIGFSHSRGSTVRRIPVLSATATSHPVTDQFIASAEGGYAVRLDEHFSLVPFAGIDLAAANAHAFVETGAGAANLAVAAQTTTSTRSVIGARFRGANIDVAGLTVNTEWKMGWAHQFTGLAPITRASFAGVAGTSFTVTGAPLPGDAGVVGLGASVAIADNASIQLRYDGQVAGNAASHTISAGVSVDW